MLSHQFPEMPTSGLIGIDGDPGAGKTTLSGQIPGPHPRTVISLDSYIDGDERPYMEQLRIMEVMAAIDSCNGTAIIEGIHLLEVLSALDLRLSYLIFYKCTMFGDWRLNPYQSYTPKAKVESGVINYYRSFEPWLHAGLIIERELF